MTTTFPTTRRHPLAFLLYFAAAALLLASCNKKDHIDIADNGNSNHVSRYSANVLDKWMTLELRLMRNATGIPNQAFSRHFAYAGVAALEAIAPGTPPRDYWRGRWNGLVNLPAAGKAKDYHYPANINAALAAVCRAFFPAASGNDKSAIDSLENALKQEFLSSEDASLVTASETYGKEVAKAVCAWAEEDGYKEAGKPYVPPVGPGLWKPTPSGYAAAVSPYWGNNRPIIAGSTDNTQPAPPTAYDTDPQSAFYKMAERVYNASQTLTEDQKAMALFWRDVPGVSSPGHWLSIVQQAVRQSNASLDKAVAAFALTGIAINDALISCWKTKYTYNLVRPVTYIREVMGYANWSSFLGTPAHPEYSSAHAVLSVAAAEVMQQVFGKVGTFTDHTYDYLGFAPRSYASFLDIGAEAAQSRLYAGIHYQPSIDAGSEQGRKVAENILGSRVHIEHHKEGDSY